MKYNQPGLPYNREALEPVISRETIDYHYGKHEKTYIDNLNNLIDGTEWAEMSLEDIIRKSDGAIFNNASQAWNHNLYFRSFSPNGGGIPTGKLGEAIEKQFGSFDEFKKQFEAVGVKLFGSGWVWLSSDCEGNLFISEGRNADNPLVKGLTPILTFDVWEHAYYLDYRNRRADYLRKLWDIVDWSVIADRYRVAVSLKKD